MLQLGELGEELALEQMRRRHDLAVADADDGRRLLAVGVEHGPVLVRRDERLIREREHRGLAVAQVRDRRAERAAHAARVLRVHRVADRQAVERRQRVLPIAPDHDEHIVEAGVADLPDRAPDERLAAERQQQLLGPHARRGARRENDRADHRRITSVHSIDTVTSCRSL